MTEGYSTLIPFLEFHEEMRRVSNERARAEIIEILLTPIDLFETPPYPKVGLHSKKQPKGK